MQDTEDELDKELRKKRLVERAQKSRGFFGFGAGIPLEGSVPPILATAHPRGLLTEEGLTADASPVLQTSNNSRLPEHSAYRMRLKDERLSQSLMEKALERSYRKQKEYEEAAEKKAEKLAEADRKAWFPWYIDTPITF